MAAQPPILDTRVLQDVLQHLQKQAAADLPEWTPSTQGDVGTMLQRIFARFMELAIQRLNQVPEKNLLAFLDAMGVTLLGPSAAEVPLVFGLAASRGPTVIPAGTQAGTKPGGTLPALTFETTEDYTVIPAKLASAFTFDPVWDRYTDQTAAIAGSGALAFTPFVGTERMPHVLYLADNLLLNFALADVAVHLTCGPAGISTNDLQNFLEQLTWQWVQNGKTIDLPPRVSGFVTSLLANAGPGASQIQLGDVTKLTVGDSLLINDNNPETVKIASIITATSTVVLQSPYLQTSHRRFVPVVLTTVRLDNIATPDMTTVKGVSTDASIVNGVTSRFLQAMLTPPLPSLPAAKSVSLQNVVVDVSAGPLVPDFTFGNQAPLDVTKNFYPFGQVPAPGDTLYIGSTEAFSKPGVNVTLTTELVMLDAPALIWEYSVDGRNWSQIPPNNIQDGTDNLQTSGPVSITLPSSAPAAGQTWVRTRLISGDYRNAPQISQFELISQSTLTSAAKAGDSSLQLSQANFAGQGQVIAISDGTHTEVQTVQSVSGGTLTLGGSLANAYATANTQIEVLGFYSASVVAVLNGAATANASSINITRYGTINVFDVLRIDDSTASGGNTEFVVVTGVKEASGSTPASLTISPPLSFNHASGVFLEGPLQPKANPRLNFFGLADQTWLDFNNYQNPSTPFNPLGTNPGSSDVFYFGTYFGYTFYYLAATSSAAPAAPTGVQATVSSAATVETAAKVDAAVKAAPTVELTDAAAAPLATETTVATTQDFSKYLTANTFSNVYSAAVVNMASSSAYASGIFRAGNIGIETLPFSFFFWNPQIIININVQVTQELPPVTLAWECLSANGWTPFTPTSDPTKSFRLDNTGQMVAITLPPINCIQGEVNGKSDYWIRVRITEGNYGLPQEYVAVDPANPQKGYQVKAGTGNLKPPELKLLQISYEAARQPASVIRQNGLLYSDQTSANAGGGFNPFLPVTDLPIPYSDPEPAFYLGLDAAFPQQPVKLWIDAAPQLFSGSVEQATSIAAGLLPQLPALHWEYFNGTAWSRLPVLDDTNNLTEAGIVEFLTPPDFASLAKFSLTPLYWIRARSSDNFPAGTQQLDGVYLNAVPAIQAISVSNETLGSSNGQASQSFTFKNTPVLAGQQVWVQEPESPSDKELAAIEAEEGAGAVQTIANSITGAPEIWVRWHEVPSFLASDNQSRHYTVDHGSGTLTFGDGQNGMVPPSGTNNIAADYQYGGGSAGNVAAGSIAQVKSALPGVVSVMNPIAADGGADPEAAAAVKNRGPQVLRNRGFAISSSDIEWLAQQADGTRVARAKCLPNVNSDLDYEPGWVTLLVVPQGADAKLVPSAELVREVESYLVARSFIGLAEQTPSRINVIGAGYIQVTVAAQVVPSNPDEAQTVRQNLIDALDTFFHPLTGGSTGTGWEFGRDVYASEVSRLLQAASGVDHLESLQLIPNAVQEYLCFSANQIGALSLPASGILLSHSMKKSALIADAFDPVIGGIPVIGFKEGDRVSRVWDLTVTSVSADGMTLTVTPFDPHQTSDAVGFPPGSQVMTLDGKQSVQLATAILPQEPVTAIATQMPFSGIPTPFVITVFNPFPMKVTSVSIDTLTLTVISVSGTAVRVGSFSTGSVGLPVSTVVTAAGGTRMSQLSQAVAANTIGVSVIQVQDATFSSELLPGDTITLQLASQTLAIEPYQPEIAFPVGSVLARLDNQVRLPLQTALPDDAESSFLHLCDFIGGDQVQVSGAIASSTAPPLAVSRVQPITDIVYLGSTFLPYSGAHQITMVEE